MTYARRRRPPLAVRVLARVGHGLVAAVAFALVAATVVVLIVGTGANGKHSRDPLPGHATRRVGHPQGLRAWQARIEAVILVRVWPLVVQSRMAAAGTVALLFLAVFVFDRAVHHAAGTSC